MLADLQALAAMLGGLPNAPVGLGIAAQLFTDTGRVAVAPNLGWRDVKLQELADAVFGRRVRLVNDVNAIAVGEARCGAIRRSVSII